MTPEIKQVNSKEDDIGKNDKKVNQKRSENENAEEKSGLNAVRNRKIDTSRTYTKIVAVSSNKVLPSDAAMAAYASGYPVTVKETCYGLVLSGTKEDVSRVAEIVRDLDKNHIFIKDRGYPVGDPRRCRAERNGGQRPGFYTLHEEISKFGMIGNALDDFENNVPAKDFKWPEKIPSCKLEEVINRLDSEELESSDETSAGDSCSLSEE